MPSAIANRATPPSTPSAAADLIPTLPLAPAVNVPVTAALPATVNPPVNVSENAVIALPVTNGAAGSAGKITSRICRVVIPGPEISITYRAGAA